MRFTESWDNVRRANLMVRHRVGRDELVTTLCASVSGTEEIDEIVQTTMTRTAIEREVRLYLHRRGSESAAYWSDDVDEDEAESLREWAGAQVDTAFPEVAS